MNELTKQVIPSEVDEVNELHFAIIELMATATEAGMSDAAVILAVVSSASSAVEHAENMTVEEALPSGHTILVIGTGPESKLSS